MDQLPDGVSRFRPRTEESFARIDRVRDGGDFWRVASRDGLVSYYGAADTDAGVLADPLRQSHIFCWMLTATTDPFGNRIEYDYRRDRGSDGPHAWDQLYLETVRYVDYEQGGQNRFLVSVRFHYEPRPDPFSDNRAGFEVRTRRRCTRIEVRTHPDGNDMLTRTYTLVYLDERVAAGELDPSVLPLNGVSLLSQIQVTGYDGSRTQRMPPLEFGYSAFTPERWRVRVVEGTNNTLPRRSLADADLDLVDLFGNGLPDIVQMNGATRFWRNLGSGVFDVPRTMSEVPAGVRLADPGTQFADLNGDGRTDLLVLEQRGYFPLSFTGRWSPQGFVRYRTSPAVPFGDGNLRLVDLDGDGVVDALRTGTSFELFFNDPFEGWDQAQMLPRGPLADFPNVSFADPRVHLADLTGDGLQDIAFIEQGRIQYWPYLGHGRWGQRVVMTGSPVFRDPLLPPDQFDPQRVLVGDMDGDGVDDVVYVRSGSITVWINESGNGWSAPITIEGTPPVADIDAVRLVDLLGTGTAGILWTRDSPASTTGAYQFADLTGGDKPYLLQEMNNRRGARTLVRYRSSTQEYLADVADPTTRWATPLPFPVQVIAAVEVVDEVSAGKRTSEFRYHHGYWDGSEREFRGFGMVEQLDTESFERFHEPGDVAFDPVERARFGPPLLTRTWFHLGPVGDEFAERREADLSAGYWSGDPPILPRPAATVSLLQSLAASHRADALRSLRGSVLRTELYAVDGTDLQDRPYTVTEIQYGICEESPPPAGASGRRRVFFPHPVAERTTQWERGTDPMHRFGFTDGYDAYGLPGMRIDLAVPRGRDFRARAATAEPYLGTCTVTTYARRDDDRRYLVDRVARTTTNEIRNDGRPSLPDLVEDVRTGGPPLAVVGESRHFYDGDAFVGLPFGQIGEFGAHVRTETLVLTEARLTEAYRDGDRVGPPPYLDPRAPAWTDEYPQPFRDTLPSLAGYTFSPGDPDRASGYFVDTYRRRYDFHDGAAGPGRGLPTASRDPLGRDTLIAYDRFQDLPVAVVDAAGLRTSARYDYRTLRPEEVIDQNGNRMVFGYSPLGLLESIAVMGKPGEPLGDTVHQPGTSLKYDLTRQPVSVRTIRRVHYATEPDLPAAEGNETVETVEYSDGFGRLVQSRVQAEDVLFGDSPFGGSVLSDDQGDARDTVAVTGRRNRNRRRPNVAVSGWLRYDNKGRVVEQYEPFLATGWEFDAPGEAQLGQRMSVEYDPRGQVIRTVSPDESQHRVVYGVPLDLTDPERFTATPWEAYTFNANDNAGRTHPQETAPYAHQWNTPDSITLDALGRTVVSTRRLRQPSATPGDPLPVPTQVTTSSRYDIRGNLLIVTDALGRPAIRYVYDLIDRPLRTESIDAGVRCSVLDAAGNNIEHRDGRGALILRGYDLLGRPDRLWARDDGAGTVTLRERVVYGDGGDPEQPVAMREASRSANRLGAVYQHYDDAGLLTFERYAFDGNVLDRHRRVIAEEAVLSVFPSPGDLAPDWRITPFRVDWQPTAGTTPEAHAATLLGADRYETSASYDALGRATRMRCPRDVEGHRSELVPTYNRAGELDRVSLDGQVVVERIAYDARGRRTLVAFGNGVLTRYAYDPRTGRPTRVRSERFTKSDADSVTYRPGGPVLRDLAYRYDLVGNLVGTVERTPGSGVAANPEAAAIDDPQLRALVGSGDALVRSFTYDSLNRLVSAGGRACRGAQPEVWTDQPRCGYNGTNHATPDQDNAPQLTGVYREDYRYDLAGNLTRLRHTTSGATSVRQLRLIQETNRLSELTVGTTAVPYRYDANGNLIAEAAARHFEWDYGDQLMAFRTQTDTAEPSVHGHYLYDADGRRVMKLVRRQGGGVVVSIYIDGVFEHHRWSDSSTSGANNHLHVLDDAERVALVRMGPAHPDDRGPALQYQLSDHLGSVSLVVDADGGFVNREEYMPYGETSFGGFGRKRYRFTGKERDEESGLGYHAARYYAPWLARWTSCDPAVPIDGTSLYRYCDNAPVTLADPAGTQPVDRELQTARNPFGIPIASPPKADDPLEIDFGGDFHGAVFVRDVLPPTPEEPEEPEESGFWSSFWGGVKIVGGIGLAVAGCAMSAGVGCVVAAAVGAGQASAGVVQLVTGEETRNPLEQGASQVFQAAGASQKTADLITQSAEAGYSLAVGVHSVRSFDPTRVPATQNEINQALHPIVEADRIVEAGGPDFVPVYHLFGIRIKGPSLNSTYRGYDPRRPAAVKLRETAQKYGAPLKGHYGHAQSHSTLGPGETGILRYISSQLNLSDSAMEKIRVRIFRQKSKELNLDPHDPKNPYFTRPTRPRKPK